MLPISANNKNFKQMAKAIFFDSTDFRSNIAAFLANFSDSTYLLKDTAGLNEASIDTLITTLTDATLTECIIAVGTAEAHATGDLIWVQVGALRAKMATGYEGATIDAGTCQANATTTEIILAAATASAVNDFYNTNYIITAGVTAFAGQITDYVGATTTCTVVTTGTAITTTETYIVYTGDYIYEDGNADAVLGKTTCFQVFETLFPDQTPPLLVQGVGGYLFHLDSGQAQSATGTTMVHTATGAVGSRVTDAQRANDIFNDAWIGIRTSTLGTGAIVQITDYVTGTDTSTIAAWPSAITPTGTIVYGIYDSEDEALQDMYIQYYTLSQLNDPTSTLQKTRFNNLIDKNGDFATKEPTTFNQDWDAWLAAMVVGKNIYDYIKTT